MLTEAKNLEQLLFKANYVACICDQQEQQSYTAAIRACIIKQLQDNLT